MSVDGHFIRAVRDRQTNRDCIGVPFYQNGGETFLGFLRTSVTPHDGSNLLNVSIPDQEHPLGEPLRVSYALRRAELEFDLRGIDSMHGSTLRMLMADKGVPRSVELVRQDMPEQHTELLRLVWKAADLDDVPIEWREALFDLDEFHPA